jgi:signal transduction histidine kinase
VSRLLNNTAPLKPLNIVPKLQKFPLTILFAISAVLFISIAIVVMNHFLADSAAGGGLANTEQATKANILRITMWAMGGLFLALSGFVIVADVIIVRANRREVAIAAARLAERERLEEQLLQAQKMESIGRLAGGVAHDFNNLLTPIVSYAQLCKMNLDEDDPLYSNLEEIEKAADRAADVTHKLLAFSRQQVIEPQDIELNRLVVDLGKMLHRLIGEDVDMSIVTAPNVGLVKVEPGQIEQVMVNLVVNARDAMLEGGKLTVTTRAVDLDGQKPAVAWTRRSCATYSSLSIPPRRPVRALVWVWRPAMVL